LIAAHSTLMPLIYAIAISPLHCLIDADFAALIFDADISMIFRH
jgi:hypothetical protein